jgi:hypothetical protein
MSILSTVTLPLRADKIETYLSLAWREKVELGATTILEAYLATSYILSWAKKERYH